MCRIPGWEDSYVEGGAGQVYWIQVPNQYAATWVSTIVRTGQSLDSSAAAQADYELGWSYAPGTSVQVITDQQVQVSGHDGWRRTCLLTESAWGTIYTTIVIFDLGGAIDAKGQVIDGWGAYRAMYPAAYPDLGAAEEIELSTLRVG